VSSVSVGGGASGEGGVEWGMAQWQRRGMLGVEGGCWGEQREKGCDRCSPLYAAHLQHMSSPCCPLALMVCMTSMNDGMAWLMSLSASSRLLAARMVAARLA
jgi:hypothetical protein